MYPERLLRLKEVMARTALSRSSIYALAARGDFPPPLKLTPRASGWLESAIDAWIASRKPSVRDERGEQPRAQTADPRTPAAVTARGRR